MTYKKSALIFVLLLAGAFLFWYFLSLQNVFYSIVDFFKGYIEKNETLGILAFVGLAAFSAMISPFSSAPLIPAAILIWGNLLTIILLSVGWVLGAVVAYYLAYSVGCLIFKRFIPFEKIEFYRQRIPERAEFFLVLLFRLAMPSEIPSYTLGLVRYNFWNYLLITALSETLFAGIYVYAGRAFLEKNPIVFVILVGLGLVAMTIAFYLLRRYLKQSSEE